MPVRVPLLQSFIYYSAAYCEKSHVFDITPYKLPFFPFLQEEKHSIIMVEKEDHVWLRFENCFL